MKGNLWSDEAPSENDILDVLVYRSRLIGSDPELVVWGGGNTSAKTQERDHLGRMREVLRIKGSGTDLKTIDRSGFPGVFRDELLPLLEREDMSDGEMVEYLEHCMLEPSGRRPSIETLLHAFLPAKHVDHTHADAIVALTNTEKGREVVGEALDDRVAYIPYRRPGFKLSQEVFAAASHHEAIVLVNHGLVTWGETAEASYRTTIGLVEQAEQYLAGKTERSARPQRIESHATTDLGESLLKLRGLLGQVILHLETGPDARDLANRADIEELAGAGPATADHVLRIRTWACVLDPDDPRASVEEYERRYREFFARHAEPGLEMLDPRPKVFLIRGVGMVTAGKDAKDARIVADVALHTLKVAARGKDAHGSYHSLSEKDLFEVDYWPLELYKLTLAPAPKELAGRIVAVTGAASGIGRAVSRRIAELGAQTVLLDINQAGLEQTGCMIREEGGSEPLEIALDLCDDEAVRNAVRRTIETYGGIDALVSNAGIAAAGKLTEVDPSDWRRALEVNATSHFVITQAVMKAMITMGLGGSIVYVGSKNAFSPGAGFGPYSTSKAALTQLARLAALEGGDHGIRANVVSPDAVFEDSGLWSEDIRAQRAAAHNVPIADLEEYYAQRNVLKRKVSGRDVAEAVTFLISDRSKVTTGAVIPVDGGVPAAFPR